MPIYWVDVSVFEREITFIYRNTDEKNNPKKQTVSYRNIGAISLRTVGATNSCNRDTMHFRSATMAAVVNKVVGEMERQPDIRVEPTDEELEAIEPICMHRGMNYYVSSSMNKVAEIFELISETRYTRREYQ